MSAPSPGPGPDPGPGSDVQTHGSPPLPPAHEEVSELSQQQQNQEQDNASMDASQPTGDTQSKLQQEESERQRLRKRLHIEPPISRERLTTTPSNFKEVEERKTYTSFGNNGTTASVSARLREILGKAQSNAATIGINWKKAFGNSWDFDGILPRLEFVDDRWPRFTSPSIDQCFDDISRNSQDQAQTGDNATSREPHPSPTLSMNFSFSVQYFCHDGAIFQKCTLEGRAHAPADLHLTQLELQADLLIRNLDFTQKSDFNMDKRSLELYRQLELFQQSTLREGSTEPRAPIYSYRLGVKKQSLEVVHRITQKSSKELGLNQPEHQKAVVLAITPYVNGKLQSLNLEGEAATMDLSEEIQDQVEECGVLDVVLAYKLRFENRTDNKIADFGGIMSKSPMRGDERYEKISFSSHPHLDFIIRRNLEHILSVCSVQIPPATPAPSEGETTTSTSTVTPTDDSDSPISLTCGDISGHYVGLAASFYALQFLREIQRYLKARKSSYANTLSKRIQTTCDRHLKWVFESTEIPEGKDQPVQSFAFSPHYWASGQKIIGTTYLPGPSRADTPLQILKIFDTSVSSGNSHFMDLIARHDTRVLSTKAKETLSKRIVAWLQDLDQNDQRKKYAFACNSPTDKPKFHLVDHIRISQVLTKLEGVYRNETSEVTRALTRFQSKLVERRILKRFITENPISKQRTLATSRTAFETRFLFHSKDTALFHAMDSWILSKEQPNRDGTYDSWKYMMDEWKNTIECQAEHEETRELKWRKPLWYALSVILASKERSINEMSPDLLLNTTGRVLFAISSASGLFPGYLTSGQVPMEFEQETNRDDYWQTTFEIPYILWEYTKEKTAKFASADSPQLSGLDERNQELTTSKKNGRFMAKKLQFANSNKLIDPRGLVEISDDWLQQGPESLKFGLDPGFLYFKGPDRSDPLIKQVAGFPSRSEEVASAGWDTYHSEVDGIRKADSFTDETREKGLVVDVPQGQTLEGNGLEKSLDNNKTLAELLGRYRDVQSAKKRLIWLPKADKETAMVCCLASPSDEQYELSAFFDRHALYDKYFSDDTSATLNEWKTEFHLSFYRLAGFTNTDDFHGQEGIPKFSYVIPHATDTQKGVTNSKQKPDMVTGIVRAALGFRFVGDFFDRYWTCHFVEYIPGNAPPKKRPSENTTRERSHAFESCSEYASGTRNPRGASTNMESTTQGNGSHTTTLEEHLSGLKYIQRQLEDPHTGKRRYPWQQRKVLELLLFDQILLNIEKETEDIFNWAQVNVLKVPGATEREGSRYSKVEAQESVLGIRRPEGNGQPYKMAASDPLNPLSEAIDSAYQFVELGDSEGYFKIIRRWRLFEEILQTLGEDLNENLERIEEWCRREEDCNPESPRWTRNDERVFRNTLNKLRIQNQRKIRNLERLNTRIKTFRDSLTGRLESIREDMSFRGSENLSLFTYVTVIFLPLGFATGIFSMSEAPENPTLTFMIATAITSLSITVFALANAKLLGKNIVGPLIEFVQTFGRPFISLVIVPFLFVVYSVEAMPRPIYHPIYIRTVEPILNLLGGPEYLKRYKMTLGPIRELDWITEVGGWLKKEKEKRKEKKEKKKEVSDTEGQRISRGAVQTPTTRP